MRLICLWLCCLYASCSVVKAEEVSVGYVYQGEQYHISGRKVNGIYVFNQQSDRVLKLATLDWPPYIGEHLCNKGWVFQFTVALLVSKGFEVQISFLPWARAVREVELGHADILFPEYFIEDASPSDIIIGKKRNQLLALSNEFPGGEIGFLKRKGEPDKFEGNLANLQKERIGVVRGYQNTPEFDAMMDNNEFNELKVVDDLQLMRILQAKRVDLIIGDPKVLKYSVRYSDLSSTDQTALLNGVEEVKPALKYNALYFALSKKIPNWPTILREINIALYEFQNSGETDRIMETASRACR